MKKFEFITSLGIVALFFFVGCGEDDDAGKTGVAPETKAVEFTSTEISSFCAWVLEASTSGEEAVCSGGSSSVRKISTEECKDYLKKKPRCKASTLEACYEALFDTPCEQPTGNETACLEVEACDQT